MDNGFVHLFAKKGKSFIYKFIYIKILYKIFFICLTVTEKFLDIKRTSPVFYILIHLSP